MSILNKTVKLDVKMKGVKLSDEIGVLLDEDGMPIDLWDSLQKAYGGKKFTLSATLTDKEDIDLDNVPLDDDSEIDEED